MQNRICFLDACKCLKQGYDIQTAFAIRSFGHLSIMTNNIRNKHMKWTSPVGRSCSHVACSSSKHFSSHPKSYPNLQWDQLKTALGSVRRKELKVCCLDNDFKCPKTVLQL